MTFTAHVHKGRLVLDEPTDLSDGAAVELMTADEELSADEHRALEQALAESDEDVRAGRVHPAADVLAELRRQ